MEYVADPWQAFHEALVHSLHVTLTAQQLQRYRTLYECLSEANKTVNLTRITTLEVFITRHLLDSLSIVPFCQDLPSGSRLLDLGSGAGFPAVPLAILLPDLQITAMEATRKKADFIQSMQETLALPNVHVRWGRSETEAHLPAFREQFQRVTARAVSELRVLVELCLPFLQPNGLFLAMKTATSLAHELEQARPALSQMGGELEHVEVVPFASLEHHRVVVIRKTASTPARYPRSPGTPQKRPLLSSG